MMAAYIIAIKGKISDALILGISAAFSHSIIVWVLALFALSYGNDAIGEELEPLFMIFSGLIVLGIAFWMCWNQLKLAKYSKNNSDHHVHEELEDTTHFDTHALAHAKEIEERLSNGRTGMWQTILFGFSGGLIPCPAAITVFILCLHLGKVSLGIILVGGFSLGLAVTLISIGSVAALGIGFISRKTNGFDFLLSKLPFMSSLLIALLGFFIIFSGYSHLSNFH
tara:strand:- start:99 stop:773 length:675 start_codon:yes stop_codon:yes gene_type:complete